jgi:hypothetical protein
MHILHTKQGYSWAKQPVESCARLVEGADHQIMLRTINLRSRGHTEKISDKAKNDRGTKTDLKRAAQNSDNL